LVCNDPRVAQYIRENFVAVATSDLEYVNRKEAGKREYAIMQRLYAQSPFPGAYQGIMLASSTGKLFEHYTDYDPESALEALKAAKRDYDRMEKSDRLLQEPLRPGDALPHWRPSREDVIDIRVTKRSLPDPRFPDLDQRNAMYFHFDYLWIKKSEVADFVPSQLKPGAERSLDAKYVERFGLTNLLTPEGQAWVPPDLTNSWLKAKVSTVASDVVHLELSGEFHLDASRPENDTKYDGRLLGRFVVSKDLRSIVAFEAVALGDAVVRTRNPAMHFGPSESKAGAVFGLNGDEPNDQMVPSGWHLAYRDF
jgi:hypothetical protein